MKADICTQKTALEALRKCLDINLYTCVHIYLALLIMSKVDVRGITYFTIKDTYNEFIIPYIEFIHLLFYELRRLGYEKSKSDEIIIS